jgi:multidrug efflux pump subunit AcrA (membrane-fusion protein)
MTANVQILITEVKSAKIVPEQAFRFSPRSVSTRKGDSQLPILEPGFRRVWKLGKMNRLQPINVKVGISGTEGIEVLSDELKPGDPLVVESIATKTKGPQTRGLRFKF